MKETIKRLVRNEQLSHAYYLEGDDGIFAKWMAKQILCINLGNQGDEQCDCSSCRRIEHDNHIDLFELFPDGTAIKVDQIRNMNQTASLRAVGDKGQIFIIHQADRLNLQASNALLKSLEEPNEQVRYILTGRNAENLLVTIRSRVQVIKIPQSTNSLQIALNQEGIDFEALPICIEAGLSFEDIQTHAEKLNEWCDIIHLTLNEGNYRNAMVWVKKWENCFSNKEEKLISIQLVQSYIKGLFAIKKGKTSAWKNLNILDWPQLSRYVHEVENLSKAIRSNGHYMLQCETFIQKAKA